VFRRKSEPPVGINRDFEHKRQAPAAGEPAGEVQNSARESDAQGAHADAAAPRASTTVPQPAQKSLGTGHGQSETSVVRYANFERASSTPDEVITIYYDSYRNLVAQGVIADGTRVARPNPFPHQFVPDPR